MTYFAWPWINFCLATFKLIMLHTWDSSWHFANIWMFLLCILSRTLNAFLDQVIISLDKFLLGWTFIVSVVNLSLLTKRKISFNAYINVRGVLTTVKLLLWYLEKKNRCQRNNSCSFVKKDQWTIYTQDLLCYFSSTQIINLWSVNFTVSHWEGVYLPLAWFRSLFWYKPNLSSFYSQKTIFK